MAELSIKLPEGFLDEEVRCDYLVKPEIKRLWAVELDLLAAFDRVCKKHGLSYCLGAGSLLGAVRHKGFIPWDDDIDLYMLRADYDKLMQLAGEFEAPIFLQNAYTEKNLFKSFARLRNADTRGYTEMDGFLDINQGVFIDIFPLDGISENKLLDKIQKVTQSLYHKMGTCYNLVQYCEKNRYGKLRGGKAVQYAFAKVFVTLFSKEKVYRRYEKALSRYSRPGAAMWGNRTIVFDCPKSRRPLGDWQDLIEAPFEFMTVPIPRTYHEMLTQQYGDYMKIPQNKNGSVHGALTVSVGSIIEKKENA